MGDAILIELRSHKSSVVNALNGAVRALPHTWTVSLTSIRTACVYAMF